MILIIIVLAEKSNLFSKNKSINTNKENFINSNNYDYADKFETRFPYMVNVKNSYDDKPIQKDKIVPTVWNNYAYLNQLPLNLKNVYNSQVTPCLYFSIQP